VNPTEARSVRLHELSSMVYRLTTEGCTTQEIIKAITKRAHQMAAPSTAKSYVDEIKRRFSK